MPTERRTQPQPVPGRPPLHGARQLARHLAAGKIDKRTGTGRDFYRAQDGLADDRGGWANTSTAEKMLIEVAAAELLIIRAMFSWSIRQPSIVTETAEGPRLLGPLAKGFTSHAGALTRALSALGLKPDVVDRLPSLEQYLAKYDDDAATPAPATATPDDAVPDVQAAPADDAAPAACGDSANPAAIAALPDEAA